MAAAQTETSRPVRRMRWRLRGQHGTVSAPHPNKRRRLAWLVASAAVAAVLVAVGARAAYILAGGNLYTVIPGQVYRASQMSEAELRHTLQTYKIRTVLNLRGWDGLSEWYQTECRILEEQNIRLVDLDLVTGRLPWPSEITPVIEAIDDVDYPILVHCYSGADRTGLVAALALLLKTDCGLDDARRQLGLWYGHISLKAPAMDQFFDLYASWLASHHVQHTAANLRWWVEHDYCPGPYRCLLEPLDIPERLPCGQLAAVRVRVHNTSPEPWHFSQSAHGGMHVGFFLSGPERYHYEGRAGKRDVDVPPGGSIDVTLVLPAVARPGGYVVDIDMVDDCGGNWFSWVGNPRIDAPIEYR